MVRRLKHRKYLAYLLPLAAIALFFLLSETVARAWARNALIPDGYPPLTTRLPAYARASYWSPAFGAEAATIDKIIVEDKHDLPTTPDTAGEWFNVRDGLRVTVGQTRAKPALYLFGASQVFGMGVPDEYTIASQLQALLPLYRVENYGRIGYATTQQFLLLKTVDLKPGDVVIWLDGTMDALSAYDRGRERVPAACNFWQSNVHHLMIVRLLAAPCLSAHAVDGDLIEQAIADYAVNIRQAADYVRRAGAAFMHFLEPTIFLAPLSHEDRLGRAGAYLADSPGLEAAFRAAWPAFQLVADNDLTHALDDLRRQRTVYIDAFHYNDEATRIVARAICDSITTF